MVTYIEQIVSFVPGTTGVVDYRSPNMTETPNACLIFVSGNRNQDIDLQSFPDARISIGFASKKFGLINQGVVGAASENGSGPDPNGYYNLANVINLTSVDGTALDARANLVDFLPDNGNGAGVRLRYTSVGADGRSAQLSIVLISCANAICGSFDSVATNNTIPVTTEFSPDTMFFLSTCCTSPVGDMELSFGAATSDLAQRCQSIAESVPAGNSEVVLHVANNRVMLDINQTTGAVVASQELTSVSGTGFTVTQRVSNTSTKTIYLALQVAPSQSKIVDFQSGVTSVTTGFRPQCMIAPTSQAAAFNTAYANSTAGYFGVNICSKPFDMQPISWLPYQPTVFHVGFSIEDNVATAVTWSLTSPMGPVTDFGFVAYRHSGSQLARARWTPTINGFTMQYDTTPASPIQLWGMVIQEPFINTNPPIRRMYSLLHGLSLSIVVGMSPLSSSTSLIRDNLVWKMTGYQHEIAANGGYVSAQLQLALPRAEAQAYLENGVGKEITVYNEGQQVVWQGVIDSVGLTVGSQNVQTGSLLDIINRVSVAYRRQSYDIPGLTIGGQERVTGVVNDTDSQDLYGILEGIINGGESSSAEAEQLRDLLADELSLLVADQTLSFGGGEIGTVTLNCIGYTELLNKVLYSSSTSGTEDASDKIEAVLLADPNNLFPAARNLITTNGFQVVAREDGQATAATIINDVASFGDTNDNRFIFGGIRNRQFYYRPIPTQPEYVLYLSDAGSMLRTAVGGTVRPWNALPGKWAIVPDSSFSRSWPTTIDELRRDTRAAFVERVQFTAPHTLTLTGGRVSSLNQALAKRGLGTM